MFLILLSLQGEYFAGKFSNNDIRGDEIYERRTHATTTRLENVSRPYFATNSIVFSHKKYVLFITLEKVFFPAFLRSSFDSLSEISSFSLDAFKQVEEIPADDPDSPVHAEQSRFRSA